jgi:hypothetical protein
MIKTMKKSLVLAAAIAAMAAIAVPSMASAANWGVINSNHTLNANIGLTLAGTMGNTSVYCNVSVGAKVRNPLSSTLDILSSTNLTCPTAGGWLNNCTLSGVPSGLPWTAIGVSTTNVQMYMNYSVTLSGASCWFNGYTYTLSGTASGVWNGNGSNQHSIVFTAAPGLTFGPMYPSASVKIHSGMYKDAQQTLTLN